MSIYTILDFFLRLDVHLANLSAQYGVFIYLILFLIIFAETGLVVTPFLPGDSLLFATGALASLNGSGLNVFLIWGLLILAAVLGDNTNYYIGSKIGPKIFTKEKSLLFNPKNLERTQQFYRKYGINTVIMARFVPIIRTFAPFVAGVGKMSRTKFILFSIFGSFLWMSIFIGAGYLFGNVPAVKRNFTLVIFSVIGLSVLPIAIGAIKSRKKL